MIGSQPPFKIGQKVRLSKRGIEATLYVGVKAKRIGIVTRVDEFNSPTVLWEGRKTASGYHPDFIEPVRASRRLIAG